MHIELPEAGTDLSSVTRLLIAHCSVQVESSWEGKDESGLRRAGIDQPGSNLQGPGESPALSLLAGLPEADPPPLFMA